MKQLLYRFISHRNTERLLTFLILLSIAAIVLESFEQFRHVHQTAFTVFEGIVVLIFTLEYLIRLYTAPLLHPDLKPNAARWRFVTSFDALIDLIAIMPFYLPRLAHLDLRFIRVLRIARLLRLLKLNRYSSALKMIGDSLRDRSSELLMAILVTSVLLLFSSTLMWHLEHEAQPEQFPNILASFWWAIATLTTVGYGDVYPITTAGKVVGGFIALLGVGLVALPAGILSASFVEHFEQSRNIKASDETSDLGRSANGLACTCPNCGVELGIQVEKGN